jgi:hypothetical protein
MAPGKSRFMQCFAWRTRDQFPSAARAQYDSLGMTAMPLIVYYKAL